MCVTLQQCSENKLGALRDNHVMCLVNDAPVRYNNAAYRVNFGPLPGTKKTPLPPETNVEVGFVFLSSRRSCAIS